jgi:predicted hydrolase (HD superfamily)
MGDLATVVPRPYNSLMHTPTRQEAWDLLTEYTESESLRRHALAVEGVMRYCARKRGYNEEKWGIVGLVHDLDWEKFPEEHCKKTEEILSEADWPEDYIRAVMSHAYGFVTDVEPEHEMEKVLYTIDELTGLVNATALMRPSRSVLDMKVKSVKKKWKDKSFAAGVNRSVIEKGAGMLGIEVSHAIEEAIMGMREVADEIDLRGNVEEG